MDTHSIPMYYHGMDRPILSAGVSLSLSLKRPRSQEPAIISFWNVTPKMLIQYIYIYIVNRMIPVPDVIQSRFQST